MWYNILFQKLGIIPSHVYDCNKMQGKMQGALAFYCNQKTKILIWEHENVSLLETKNVEFFGTSIFPYSTICAIRNGKYGLLNFKNEIIMPFVADDMKRINNFIRFKIQDTWLTYSD